jgi:hypothetical protein
MKSADQGGLVSDAMEEAETATRPIVTIQRCISFLHKGGAAFEFLAEFPADPLL